MNMKTTNCFARCIAAAALLLTITIDVAAQSAIYACGHIRRERETAIDKLRSSGYTTAIIFNVNVEADGTLTTDFTWDTQTAAEAGGIICQNGEYVFDEWQPYYVDDIKRLLEEPTSIERLELCVGGWGNGAYGNIKTHNDSCGLGEETMLYQNFKALKEVLPEIVAVNNDQEQDYDVATAVAFHKMLYEIGYKTTIVPYTNSSYWRSVVKQLNAAYDDAVEIIYLQTHGGGSGNDPSVWQQYFDSSIPMYGSFDCESDPSLERMERDITYLRDNDDIAGAFIWNYNSEDCDVNVWATALNRIIPPRSDYDVAVTLYEEGDSSGYAVTLPEGAFPQAEMAVYGVTAADISAVALAGDYVVTLYTGDNMDGDSIVLEADTDLTGTEWDDVMRSIRIVPTAVAAISSPSGGTSPSTIAIAPGGTAVTIGATTGATGGASYTASGGTTEAASGGTTAVSIYNMAGERVILAYVPCSGGTVSTASLPAGAYVVEAAGITKKFIRQR